MNRGDGDRIFRRAFKASPGPTVSWFSKVNPVFYEKSVIIRRTVNLVLMTMPEERRAASPDGLIENHQYFDICGISVSGAKELVTDERVLLEHMSKVGEEGQEKQLEDISETLREDMSPLTPFDLGVGGLVYALSSIGCVPISSCNGGVMGDFHALEHPWLIFYSPTTVVVMLLKAAEQAGVGLTNYENGMLEAFSGSALGFNKMADFLLGNYASCVSNTQRIT